MVIDTSALMGILLHEPEAPQLALAIESAPLRLLSAANFLEASMVIEARKGPAGALALDSLLSRSGIEIIAVDHIQASIARNAWRIYGKGRHPANLNFGDCFAYALAKVKDCPLLYKGEDFSLTDVAGSLNPATSHS